ncbi:MAG: hypothetical protein FJY19_00250 [Bacteroidetes bacterium]|nr:hypothetical protein [Bacteroidota bacterium]
MQVVFLIPWHRRQYANSGLTNLMAKWVVERPADKCMMLAPSASFAWTAACFINVLPRLGYYFPFLRYFLLGQKLKKLNPDLLITEPGVRIPKSINQLLWINQPCGTVLSKKIVQQIADSKIIAISSVLLLDQYTKLQYSFSDKVIIVPPVLAPVYENQSLQPPALYIKIVGTIPDEAALINTLKAFSLFKRRQQSELQLVFSQDTATLFPAFIQKLNSYKYKAAVVINSAQTPEQEVHQEAGAYALLTLGTKDQLDFQYRKASQLQVPLLQLPENNIAEANPIDQLAEQLMRVYKDESYRKQLVITQQSLFLLLDNQAAFNQLLATVKNR